MTSSGDNQIDLAGGAFELGHAVAGRFLLTGLLSDRQVQKTFVAHDRETKHEVVVKLIPEANMSLGAMRLEYEAAQLAQIRSDHLAGVLHAGREQGCFWLVTEFVPGRSLWQRLASGRLELAEAMVIARARFGASRPA